MTLAAALPEGAGQGGKEEGLLEVVSVGPAGREGEAPGVGVHQHVDVEVIVVPQETLRDILLPSGGADAGDVLVLADVLVEGPRHEVAQERFANGERHATRVEVGRGRGWGRGQNRGPQHRPDQQGGIPQGEEDRGVRVPAFLGGGRARDQPQEDCQEPWTRRPGYPHGNQTIPS